MTVSQKNKKMFMIYYSCCEKSSIWPLGARISTCGADVEGLFQKFYRGFEHEKDMICVYWKSESRDRLENIFLRDLDPKFKSDRRFRQPLFAECRITQIEYCVYKNFPTSYPMIFRDYHSYDVYLLKKK